MESRVHRTNVVSSRIQGVRYFLLIFLFHPDGTKVRRSFKLLLVVLHQRSRVLSRMANTDVRDPRVVRAFRLDRGIDSLRQKHIVTFRGRRSGKSFQKQKLLSVETRRELYG